MVFSKAFYRSITLGVLVTPALLCAAPDEKLMGEAFSLREQGEFEKATRLLQSWLDNHTTDVEKADRRAVEFEVERIRRIRMDYTTTREALLKTMQDELTTFTESELDNYEREGKLDVLLIDGQKLYADVSDSNLLFREASLRARLKKKSDNATLKNLYEQMLTAHKARELTSMTLVCPQDYIVTSTVVVKPNEAPEGKTIRAWLPLAASFPYQSDIEILKAEPEIMAIAAPEFPHRTVYMEQTAKKDSETTFTMTFVYRRWIQQNDLDPALVKPYAKNEAEYAYYTAERKPHIDFSSEDLKRIDNEVKQGDNNPLLMARRIFDWVAQNTVYQYSREYGTLDNLSQYVASRRAGDCGQRGMLFIALCRMNGIPARWATGWQSFNARGYGMHDWAEFYVRPWGWLPADPDMAGSILVNDDDYLTTAQRTELSAWMFGNMDNRRLTLNRDHSRSFFPEKTDFRSDTIDFQRGEVEADGKNLYYNQWKGGVRIQPISAEEAEKLRSRFRVATVPMPPKPTPTPTPTPAPTPEPTPTPTPAPAAPETSATVVAEEKSTAPVEEKKPEVTATPEVTPEVKETPKPEPTPAPTPEVKETPKPEPTPTPEPTTAPTPEVKETPKPEPTATPEPEKKDDGTTSGG